MESTEALDFLERPIAKFKLDTAAHTGAASKIEASLSHVGRLDWDDGAENTVRMRVAVAKNASWLTEETMVDAVRETDKFWPAMGEYGIGGFSSAYLHALEEEPDFLRHAFCMDLRTFVDTFSDPVTLVDKVSVAADAVVQRWSEGCGGIRPGELTDDSFRLRDVVQVGNRREVKNSTLVIAVGLSRDRWNEAEAKIGPNDTAVRLRLLKGYPSGVQRFSNCGVSMPFPAFVKLVESDEMRSAIELGRDFLENLEPSDPENLRWRFVKGDDPASEGAELRGRLASKRKRRNPGGEGAGKRQKAGSP